MSDFDLPPDTVDDTGSLDHFRRRIQADLSPDERKLETLLTDRTWFPYRRLDFIDRTHEFVRAYDRIFLSLAKYNQDKLHMRFIAHRRGNYLKFAEVFAPWVQITKTGNRINPRWKHWVEARRSADLRGMIYDDFVAGALTAVIKRGWAHWPGPRELLDSRLLGQADAHDATIPNYVGGLYEKIVKSTDDPWFRADAFVEDPIQVAYYRHFAAELVRLYGQSQRAERAWAAYQRDGKIATCLSFSAALS
jgi:hypothetical protein